MIQVLLLFFASAGAEILLDGYLYEGRIRKLLIDNFLLPRDFLPPQPHTEDDEHKPTRLHKPSVSSARPPFKLTARELHTIHAIKVHSDKPKNLKWSPNIHTFLDRAGVMHKMIDRTKYLQGIPSRSLRKIASSTLSRVLTRSSHKEPTRSLNKVVTRTADRVIKVPTNVSRDEIQVLKRPLTLSFVRTTHSSSSRLAEKSRSMAEPFLVRMAPSEDESVKSKSAVGISKTKGLIVSAATSETKELFKVPPTGVSEAKSNVLAISPSDSADVKVLRNKDKLILRGDPSKCTDREGYRIRCPTPKTRKPSLRPYRPRKKWTTPTTTTTRTTYTGTITTETTTTISTTYYDDDTTTELTTELTTTPEPNEIGKLLRILQNLTYIYDTDLVQRMNRTLHEEGYPYCPTSVSETTTATTEPPFDNLTGSTVSKCFVCGLDIPGIPEAALCADAFAGDFFPTAPADISSRGHHDVFRKHCKYLNIRSWHVNGTKDKFMWGRWTGGCAVRWIDLSGVYTQRTCRNRNRPALGQHFGSKRMAKLELALVVTSDSRL